MFSIDIGLSADYKELMNHVDLANKPTKNSLPGLYHCRCALGLQQSELAQMSGVSVGHISRIETGVADCRTDICAKLADALGVTPNDLMLEPSKIRICKLRLQHLQKLVSEEQAKLEQLQQACSQSEAA